MILCCWSSNARLSQRILKLQMPTAKVGYRAPKRKAQHRTQPPFFSSDLFLYMSSTGLAKLRKRRLHSSPRSVCIGGLGVVLCTAFLFEVQTTPRYASCSFLKDAITVGHETIQIILKGWWNCPLWSQCLSRAQDFGDGIKRCGMKLFRWGSVREGSTQKKQIGIRKYQFLD